jgi:hypothetical protein
MGCFQSSNVSPIPSVKPTWNNIGKLSPARLITMDWRMVRSVADNVNSPVVDKLAGTAEHNIQDFTDDFAHNRSFSEKFVDMTFNEILVCSSDMKQWLHFERKELKEDEVGYHKLKVLATS